jgi:hypothetical protein
MSFSHDLRPLNLIWKRTTLDYVLEGYFVKEVLLAGLGRPVRQFAVDDNQNIQLGNDLLFVTFELDMVKPLLEAVESGCRNGGVLHMGDEFGQNDRAFYARADYVLRNYWIPNVVRPTGVQSTPVLWVPNGYRTGVGPIDPTRTLPFGHRTIEGFFSGVLELHDSTAHRERTAMVEAVQQANLPFVVAGTSGFAQGLGPVSYGGYLGNSKFALVPAGNSPETVRLYEALEHGAIPILLESEFVFSSEALGAIGRPPLVLLDQWSSLPKMYRDLTATGPVRMEERRLAVLDWWTRFKAHQQNRVREVVEASFAKAAQAE